MSVLERDTREYRRESRRGIVIQLARAAGNICGSLHYSMRAGDVFAIEIVDQLIGFRSKLTRLDFHRRELRAMARRGFDFFSDRLHHRRACRAANDVDAIRQLFFSDELKQSHRERTAFLDVGHRLERFAHTAPAFMRLGNEERTASAQVACARDVRLPNFCVKGSAHTPTMAHLRAGRPQ